GVLVLSPDPALVRRVLALPAGPAAAPAAALAAALPAAFSVRVLWTRPPFASGLAASAVSLRVDRRRIAIGAWLAPAPGTAARLKLAVPAAAPPTAPAAALRALPGRCLAAVAMDNGRWLAGM